MAQALHSIDPHPPAARSAPLGRRSLLIDLDGGFSEHGIRHRRRARYCRSLAWTVTIAFVSVLRRFTDILVASVLLVGLSPLLLLLFALAVASGGGVRKRECLGRWAARFEQYDLYFPPESSLVRMRFVHSLPALWNVIRGEMSLVGPRPVSPHESLTDDPAAWKRYDLRPGLLSLWWLRKRANMAYVSESGLDMEYVETNTLWGDLGIAVRAIPAMFLRVGRSEAPGVLRFLGVRIDNLTMAEAARRIISDARERRAAQVCFVNADCVNLSYRDSDYGAVLGRADLVLADGIGVRVAGAVFNQNIRENINGTDMLPYLCEAAEEAGLSMYLLGGRPGVPEGAAAWMAAHYPQLRVAGVRDGYFSEQDQANVIREIKATGADILLVALGAPRQDKWIAKYGEELEVGVAIGVGGLLDFYSGRIQRAPVWVRELGMEWFYRFSQEPRRMWRRYFVGNAVFLFRVARERVRNRRRMVSEGGAVP